MILNLSPTRGLPGAPETTIAVAGDVITVDGVAWNLAPIPEGGEGWFDGPSPFVGPITRQAGVIHATVVVRLGDTAAPDQPAGIWTVAAPGGPVAIPAIRREVMA